MENTEVVALFGMVTSIFATGLGVISYIKQKISQNQIKNQQENSFMSQKQSEAVHQQNNTETQIIKPKLSEEDIVSSVNKVYYDTSSANQLQSIKQQSFEEEESKIMVLQRIQEDEEIYLQEAEKESSKIFQKSKRCIQEDHQAQYQTQIIERQMFENILDHKSEDLVSNDEDLEENVVDTAHFSLENEQYFEKNNYQIREQLQINQEQQVHDNIHKSIQQRSSPINLIKTDSFSEAIYIKQQQFEQCNSQQNKSQLLKKNKKDQYKARQRQKIAQMKQHYHKIIEDLQSKLVQISQKHHQQIILTVMEASNFISDNQSSILPSDLESQVSFCQQHVHQFQEENCQENCQEIDQINQSQLTHKTDVNQLKKQLQMNQNLLETFIENQKILKNTIELLERQKIQKEYEYEKKVFFENELKSHHVDYQIEDKESKKSQFAKKTINVKSSAFLTVQRPQKNHLLESPQSSSQSLLHASKVMAQSSITFDIDRLYSNYSHRSTNSNKQVSSILNFGLALSGPLGECRFLNEISKQYVLGQIRKLMKHSVSSTQMIYKFEASLNKIEDQTQLFPIISNATNILLLAQLAGGKLIGAFAEDLFDKFINTEEISKEPTRGQEEEERISTNYQASEEYEEKEIKAALFDLSNRKCFRNKSSSNAISVSEESLIWGNEELKINFKEEDIFYSSGTGIYWNESSNNKQLLGTSSGWKRANMFEIYELQF